MLDTLPRIHPDLQSDQAILDSMKSVFASLSEEELEAFEDDLNFCRFTGVPSKRIEAMIAIVAKATPELAVALNEVDHAA
jgi:hypothetical protein